MIELQHVSKTFENAGGRVDALRDVSLTIAGLIAAADKDHAVTGTYYIVRDSRSSGGSR